MYPVLIKLGPITIHSYGFMMALGVVAAILFSSFMARKYDIDRKRLSDFYFYTILIGLFGAKLFLYVTEFDYYTKGPGTMKDLLFSGGTFYGGLICGGLFAAWFIRKEKWDFKILGDIIGPSVALAHFFGRMGCFLAGCCWGREAHQCAIAVTFSDSAATTGVPQHTPLFPTQLMESILNLLNFVVLLILFKRKKFHGQIFAIYVFNYSLIRFFVEFFRGDSDRGYIFGGMEHPFTSFSVPQLISLSGVILAIFLYRRFKKKAGQKEH